MAHHQHHGADYDANSSRSLQTRPAASPVTLPAISEDELAAEADEPPDPQPKTFTKTAPRPPLIIRRESLLTKAFHTDSESHEEEFVLKPIICHNPSVSSTCSTVSGRSAGDFTSDDGLTSPGTRASTPSSPRSVATYTKQMESPQKSTPRLAADIRIDSDPSKSSQNNPTPTAVEPSVEAQLGRKRCISFTCGRRDTNTSVKPAPESTEEATKPEPPRRACMIKFLCPSKAPSPKNPVKDGHPRNARLHSPAPPSTTPTSHTLVKRPHRDSDVTVKNDSPKAATHTTSSYRVRRPSNNPAKTEATRFHEFATSDEETEDWMQESTCHRSRLTVTDTLKKENDIRQLAEEVEEEAMEEEEVDEDSQNELYSEFDEDDGFQTDDEEGFAESDDDSESDSDYEWWAPRRSPAASPFIPSDFFRPSTYRTASDSSLDLSGDEGLSPKGRRESETKLHKKIRPVAIRPTMPELPDSTDFICGTLDEDRPLEQAYMSRIRERKAAKHRAVPQDIDPTFPTSDPEVEKDEDLDEEDEVEDELDDKVTESDHPAFLHGHFEADDEEPRGLRHGATRKRSPHHSPRRLRSPPAPIKRGRSPAPSALTKRGRSPATTASINRGRSPAPRGMFFHGSPMRLRSPPPAHRLTSPPPSRRGSANASPAPINMLSSGQALLGQRNYTLTHTSSLPRSPHPFGRRRRSSAMTAVQDPQGSDRPDDDEEDTEDNTKPYSRGAIDIVQGLEHKRLKRREKLFKQYWKQQEKKKTRRPQPGRGAERMRQVGIECAIYRGKRILSV